MRMLNKSRRFLKSSEFIVLIILILVMMVFYFLNPAFLTFRNMADLLRTMIVTGILACGVMIVIISGGIDMSFMTIAICSAYITIRFFVAYELELPFFILAIMSMSIGILFGMCNAFLINTFEMPIFIATLSLATTIRGLMLAFVGNEYIPSSDMPKSTVDFSKMYCFTSTDSGGATFGLHFAVFI
ncbi:MAG: ABC transporter permease, partial [Christensenellaceae bacterium]|nr:ABC transporter permease [Christensenellaceae bacterium]